MTPGTYIKLRREAAGLSIAAVMAVLAGGGLLSAPMEELEADQAVPTGMDAALLFYAFPIDDMLLARLKAGEPVQMCRECGCSEGFECYEQHLIGTCWLPPRGETCSGCILGVFEHEAIAA